jgi:cytochrome c biogenesis protein CcmG/thiol:disulfide interchange protein DsbE
LPLIFFGLIGFFLWRGLYNDPHRIPSALIDQAMPSFKMTNLFYPNENITQKIFNGHVSILNVFASWCMYCLSEHAIMMDLARPGDVEIYGLNYKDNREKAMKWLERYGNPFHKIIYDPTGQLAMNLGVYGTPETFIIDAQGIVRYRYAGPITQQVLQQSLMPEIERLKQEELQHD